MPTTSNSSRLEGRIGIVTGAASGIGRACSELFIAEGARVACLDRNADALRRLQDDLGAAVLTAPCDVADEASVAAAFERVQLELGTIDIAALCAGVYLADQDSAVHSLSLDAWQQTVAVNLTGMFLSARETARAMLEGAGGSIVMIGSPTGIFGMELGMHAYSASKGGVHGLARVMANEYAAHGIRVNLVVPGFIRTGLNAALFEQPGFVDPILAKIPSGRAGEPSEIASLVGWLSSEDASYATGGIFTVDGGLTAI